MPAQRQSAKQGHVHKHERKTRTNSRSSGISNAWSTGAAAEKLGAVAKGRPSFSNKSQKCMVGATRSNECVCFTFERLTTALWTIGRYMVCEARVMFANSHEI